MSLVEVTTGDRKKGAKTALLILAISGFGIAFFSSLQAETDKKAAQKAAAKSAADTLEAKQQLTDLKSAMALVKSSVGDLSVLNEISADAKYYVRIAVDISAERLARYLNNIETNFPGSTRKGIACIRYPGPGSQNYKLVFGQGLDLAAAEVFHRLATSHHLPPYNKVKDRYEIAFIVPEDGSLCWRPGDKLARRLTPASTGRYPPQ